jgi:ABC-type sulfate transport system permease component
MRKTAIVVFVAALFASTAAVSVRHQRRWTEKLDGSLTQAAHQTGADAVRVLIRVRPGTTDHIVSHLAQHGLKPQRAAADAVAVLMPASMLRSLAGDADVVSMSAEAPAVSSVN